MTAISSGPLGNLAAAEEAGFPAGLLIPILPANAKPGGNVDFQALKSTSNVLGKAPFRFSGGMWRGIGGWQSGVTAEIRRESDAAGANAGLILGSPDHGETYIALDVDTEWSEDDTASQERAEEICEIVIQQTAGNLCGRPVWCRVARQRRVVILFRVADHKAGKKVVWRLHEGAVDRGKLEVLALGQQVVIGGTHASNGGTPIRWFLGSHDGQRTNEGRYPVASEIPVLRDRQELDFLLNLIEGVLTDAKLTITRPAAKATSARPADVSPEDQAPPSADKLVETLDAAPNPPDLERPEYVQVMRAVSGCIRALYQLKRLGPDDQERIRDAALGWAERWEGGVVDPDEELQKWEDDYARNPADTLGWPYIASLAVQWGSQDPVVLETAVRDRAEYRARVAQSEFTATEEAPVDVETTASRDGVSAAKIRRRASPVAASAEQLTVDLVMSEDRIASAWSAANHARFLRIDGCWHELRGHVYQLDRTDAIEDSVRQHCRQLSLLHEAHGNKATASKVSSLRSVRSVVGLAGSDRRHAAVSEDFDVDAYALNTPEGVVNLKTGAMRPHGPDDRFLRSTSVVPAGDCPRWLRFIEEITLGDQDLQAYLQRWTGYAATGVTTEHAVAFAIGSGQNGKSLFMNTLGHSLGSYKVDSGADLICERRGGEEHATLVQNIKGARLVLIAEVPDNRPLHESQLKRISAADPLSARGMNENFSGFAPVAKLIAGSNHRPVIRNPDYAMRRRLHMIPFRYKPERPDPLLQETLRAELPGILRWIIEGARMWHERGLGCPEVVEAETNELFGALDSLQEWCDSYLEPAPGTNLGTVEAFESWKSFALARGLPPHNSTWFTPRVMEKAKLEKYHTWHKKKPGAGKKPGVPVFRDVQLRAEPNEFPM